MHNYVSFVISHSTIAEMGSPSTAQKFHSALLWYFIHAGASATFKMGCMQGDRWFANSIFRSEKIADDRIRLARARMFDLSLAILRAVAKFSALLPCTSRSNRSACISPTSRPSTCYHRHQQQHPGHKTLVSPERGAAPRVFGRRLMQGTRCDDIADRT
jgi:hypothetical protein